MNYYLNFIYIINLFVGLSWIWVWLELEIFVLRQVEHDEFYVNLCYQE